MKKNNRLKERLIALYRRYKSEIDDAAQVTGLPPELIVAVMYHESGGNPKAVSRAGARGLMQLMPRTARGLGVSDPFDPRQNILGGARYLRAQLDRFGGNLALALAAYNAGPGNVYKYKRDIPPFRETQRYVRSIGQLLQLYAPSVLQQYAFTAPSLKSFRLPSYNPGEQMMKEAGLTPASQSKKQKPPWRELLELLRRGETVMHPTLRKVAETPVLPDHPLDRLVMPLIPLVRPNEPSD